MTIKLPVLFGLISSLFWAQASSAEEQLGGEIFSKFDIRQVKYVEIPDNADALTYCHAVVALWVVPKLDDSQISQMNDRRKILQTLLDQMGEYRIDLKKTENVSVKEKKLDLYERMTADYVKCSNKLFTISINRTLYRWN